MYLLQVKCEENKSTLAKKTKSSLNQEKKPGYTGRK